MNGTFRRAMVTGGASFLGRRLCRCLLEQGTDVVCVAGPLTDGRAGLQVTRGGPRLEFLLTDMAEPFDVPGEVDLVVHLRSPAMAADYPRYPLETLDHGSVSTRNALDLAAGKGARFVLASAGETHGDPRASALPAGQLGSLDPIGPRNAFDEATRYAEALASAYRREGIASTAIARVFNSYGSGMRPDDGRMLSAVVSQALRGEPVILTGGGGLVTSLCHADDTVRGLLLLAASDMGGPVNIGSPRGRHRRRDRHQGHRAHRVVVGHPFRSAAARRADGKDTRRHLRTADARLRATGAAPGGSGRDRRLVPPGHRAARHATTRGGARRFLAARPGRGAGGQAAIRSVRIACVSPQSRPDGCGNDTAIGVWLPQPSPCRHPFRSPAALLHPGGARGRVPRRW